jgi:nucleoside phosphorylase
MLETESKGGPIGILAALAGELGLWRGRGEVVSSAGGLEVRRVVEAGEDVLVCVGGVGKVAAARGAEALLRCGVGRGLLVVGTCGAVSRDLAPGELVHCGMAVQADLGVVEGRAVWPDEGLRMAWEAVVEGPRVEYLTADRALMSGWRRWRVRRGCSGPCVAEMETAAAGVCARAWGVPWAALRAVTDRAGWGSGKAFQKRYPVEAGRAADSVAGILARLRARG